MRFSLRQLPVIRAVVDRMVDDGRPLFQRFMAPPRIDRVFLPTDGDTLPTSGGHASLLRRFGAHNLLAYYGSRLWPNLEEQPTTPAVSRARIGLALDAMETASRFGHSAEVVPWARRAAEHVASARLADQPSLNIASRKIVADEAVARVRHLAHHYADLGHAMQAVSLFEIVAGLGRLTPADKVRHVALLWRSGERDSRVLAAFVGRIGDEGGTEALPPGLSEFTRKSIAIDESTAPGLVTERLMLNCSLVINSKKPQPHALRSAGLGLLKLNQPGRALEYLLEAQRVGDDGGADSFYLAQAHYGLQRFNEASESFQRAAAQGYSKARIAAWRSMALAKSGEYDAAIVEFEASESQLGTADVTSEFFVYWGRASYLYGQGNAAGAAEAKFARARALDPNDWRAATGLAACLERSGRRDEAIAVLRDCVDGFRQRSCPGAPAYLLARLLHAEGALPEAMMYYRIALHAHEDDPQYRLALALVLDDLRDDQAIAALEQAVATPGAAHPELHRRLVLSCFGSGDRVRGRHHLERLCEAGAAPPAAHAMLARDRISRAIETYNGAQFAEAARQFAVVDERTEDVIEAHALAVVYDVWTMLRQETPSRETRVRMRAEVDAAQARSQASDVRFLAGFFALIDGDVDAARDAFAALAERDVERTDCRAMLDLTSLLAGADGVSGVAVAVETPPEVATFILIFQAQVAAKRGDFPEAAARFETWASQVGTARQLGLSRERVNVFAAFCLRRGAQRPAHVLRTLARLSELYGDDFWDLAPVLVKHHDIVSRGTAQATPQRIDEGEAAYRRLLDRKTSDPNDARLEAILEHYVRWVQFRLFVHIERRDIVSARVALAELDRLPGGVTPTVRHLREQLDTHLGADTHEAAYSLLRTDPDRAQRIWENILRGQPGDVDALQHLACLHWSRAFDAIEENRFDQSLPHWRAGLDYYCQLYAIPGFWDALAVKGRSIVQPGKPFKEDEFAEWRQGAALAKAEVLLDLVVHVLHEDKRRGVQEAAALMTIIRESRLEARDRQRLSDDFATRRLDPDPMNLPDFEASRLRAVQVIDVDADNVKARSFLLRAVVHHTHELHARGNRDFPALRQLLDGVERHADWLAGRVNTPDGRRTDLVQDLVSYYDEVAEITDRQGQDGINGINAALERVKRATDHMSQRDAARDCEQRLRQVQSCLRASDAASRKALQFEPADFKAAANIDNHKENHRTIENLLPQMQRI